MHNSPGFKQPGEVVDSDEALDLEQDDIDDVADDNDSDYGLLPRDSMSEDDDYEDFEDTDDLDDDDDDDEDDLELMESATTETNKTKASSDNGPGTSSGTAAAELNESDEEDETVRAFIAARNKPRSAPPEIKLDDFITDISLHPSRDIIALGTISGDVFLYEYKNEGNKLLRTVEIHAKACRSVEFSEDGFNLMTCSKDKSIMVTDMETEKLKKFYESAHDDPINKLLVIDDNTFATGDDVGMVKLWDLRAKHEVFALKSVEDYITQLMTNDDSRLLLCTSGDGYLTTLNLRAKKLFVQSEPYEEELTCMGLYRGESKLVVGTTKGRLYTYNWGQFAYHCDMFPGVKSPMNVMVPITDRMGCVAGEDGIIRGVHVAPFRNLGIVGQHTMPVESMDVNHSGELIATSSHNNDVRFWNVKYFEDFGDIKYNEKHNAHKEKSHNLPSSKFSNAGDFFADMAKPPSDTEN